MCDSDVEGLGGEGGVSCSEESEFRGCKVHLSLPSDCSFPLMCMSVCVCAQEG